MTTLSDTRLTDTATLTDRAVTASADRIVHAARAMDRPHRVDDDLAVAWQGDRGLFTNTAYVTAEPDDWDDVVARIGTVVAPGRPVSLVSPWTVPDLSARGWQLIGHPPLMVRPVDASAAPWTGPQVPAELTISEVGDETALETFERTLVDAYPEPFLQPYRWGDVYDGRVLGGPTRFFTGSVAGRALATAAGHVAGGVNVVEMVATDPTVRGRGYGAALTWRTATLEPALPAILIASDLGRPVYEQLGFVAVSRWTFWHRPA